MLWLITQLPIAVVSREELGAGREGVLHLEEGDGGWGRRVRERERTLFGG